VLELALVAGGEPGFARVRQLPGGELEAEIRHCDGAAAAAHLRFVLAVDVDVAPYLAIARDDPLLRGGGEARSGRRPLRTSTVAQATIRAATGQLIASRRAREIERAILRCTGTPVGDLVAPPTGAQLRARLSAAQAERCGLSPARAAAVVALAGRVDLDRLRGRPVTEVAARIARERGFGPWSAGVVCLHGIGSYRFGPVGDLGLMRMCTALLGRPAEVGDTSLLLDRYAPWAGLAGAQLLLHPLARSRGGSSTARGCSQPAVRVG